MWGFWESKKDAVTATGDHIDAFLRLPRRSTRNVERSEKGAGQLAPKNILLSQLLGKVLLHHISAGIQNAGALPDEKKAEKLRTFLTTTTDLNLGESAEEIMRDAKRGVLFCEEAALSETDCGTFWTELSATRPMEDYYNHVDPDGLFELFSELSSAYAYFGGKKDEEMGEAQDYQNALEEAYHTHWQNKVLLHPDVERAKGLLAQGKFPDYEDICREILLVEYPEEVPHETAEDFDELSWEHVLDDVFADDPEKRGGDVAAASGHRRTVSENRCQNSRETASGLGLVGVSN